MTATEVLVACPACDGHGEHGTHQDYWGSWDTEPCRPCNGLGEVTPEEAEQIRADLAEQAER